MQLSRRGFIGHMTGGGVLLASTGILEMSLLKSCNPADVWHEIEAWVPTGIEAFDSIVALLDPAMAVATSALAAMVEAGFSALSAAIDSYLNAPAVDKVTWGAKVRLVLSQLGADIQSFLTAIGQTANPIVKIIATLIQILVDTIAGFMNKIAPAAAGAFRAEFHVGSERIVVSPTLRDRKRFMAVFNNACVSAGHPELTVPHALPLNK